MDLNNSKINTYLDEICSLIKNTRVHSEVKDELLTHIKKLILHYKKLGYSEDESVPLALKDMGSSKKLGNELNQTHKPSFDFKLLGTLCALIIIGFIGVFSFADVATQFSKAPLSSLAAKNAICFPIIIVFFFIGCVLNFKWLKKLSIPLYIFGLLLCIPRFSLYFTLFITIPFNPNIFIPILFLFGLSGIYTMLKFDNYKSYFLAIILASIPLFAMILPSSMRSYAKIYSGGAIGASYILIAILSYSIASFVLIYIHSKKVKLLISTIIIETLILATMLFNAIITIFFYNDASNISTLKNVLLSSKLIGNSGYYTDPNTSYPITGLIAHLGFIPAIIIIALLLYFVFRLYKCSFKINNLFGRSLTLSISTIFAVRIIIGILMNLNLLPYMNFSIPFMAFNGFSLVITAFLLGIFTNIYKVKTLVKV